MPGSIPQREVSLEQALGLLERVRAEAAAQGLAVSAAVVDRGGNTVASARMDGAALGAMALAVDKAYTAVLWQTPTGEFMASTQPGGPDWGFNTTTGGRVVVYAGGLPLFEDGGLIGGIGVSGGTGEQDEACAKAAVSAAGLG
ncbi:MAG: GlcG/HbpS family heme-binding protein [Gaiellales bacterium]